MTDDEAEIETGKETLTVRRTFDAPRERVYRAFTDPNELERWFAPGTLTPEVHTLELEPGGILSFSFVDGENRIDIEGTYEEIAENERIVHTWNYPGEAESRVTYEFRAVEGGTEVVLTHEGIGPYEELTASENVDGYAEGWPSALAKLTAVLQERGGR